MGVPIAGSASARSEATIVRGTAIGQVPVEGVDVLSSSTLPYGPTSATQTRPLAAKALHKGRSAARPDWTAALWTACLSAIERGAIGDDVAETGSLFSRHQGVPPAGFCLLRGCGM